MKRQWEKLETCLKSSNPSLLADLAPPATDAEIVHLEQRIGTTLPADFVACLKIHNGQFGDADGLFSGAEFLSINRMLQEWTIWKELFDAGDFSDAAGMPEKGICSLWWSPGWIPFTYNGAGDHLCLDLSPTAEGSRGQVITLWHDDSTRAKQADSFTAWFSHFTDQLISA